MLRTTNSQHGYSKNGGDSFSCGGGGGYSARGDERVLGRQMDADGGLGGRKQFVKKMVG